MKLSWNSITEGTHLCYVTLCNRMYINIHNYSLCALLLPPPIYIHTPAWCHFTSVTSYINHTVGLYGSKKKKAWFDPGKHTEIWEHLILLLHVDVNVIFPLFGTGNLFLTGQQPQGCLTSETLQQNNEYTRSLRMCWGHRPHVLHLRQQPKMGELSGASPVPTLDTAVRLAASSALNPEDVAIMEEVLTGR